jgi:osmotically-inducible protein OsmY
MKTCHIALLVGFGAAGSLSACAPLILAGAGTAAVAAHDRRTLGAFIDDETIELKTTSALKSDEDLRRDARINVTSMNGIVLLSGEAASAELRDRALARTREVGGIRRITNEIRVAPVASLGARGHDAWITTKVKTRLIHTDDLDSTRVKVVTENDAVYLMGLVTQKEAALATDAARAVDGATRVVKLFEYID